MHCLI